MALKFIQDKKTTLAGGGCTSTATSIVLNDLTLPDGVTAITTSDLGSLCFATLEPATSREEQISFTGITDNANGTYTITGVTRGLRFVSPYDEVTANKFAHAGGAIFIITNTAKFYDTIKSYIDGIAIAGAPNATTILQGLVELPTTAEVNAGTATGGTGAALAVTPDALLASNYGLNTPTANQKIAITSLGNAILPYAADAQASDTYVVTLSPVPSAYTAGMTVSFKANTVNTGAATLNVNSLGAKSIVKSYNLPLATGDIKANQIVEVIYDGTNFQLLSPVTLPAVAFGSTTKDLADASGAQTIAHGLAATPRYVKLTSTFTVADQAISFTTTNYNGTQYSLYSFSAADGADTGAGATFRISASDSTYQEGVVTVDATNITITWTKTSTPTGIADLIWEAYA